MAKVGAMDDDMFSDLAEAVDTGAADPTTEITNSLGREIAGGHYRDNQKFEDDATLAQQLGIDESVVRAAKGALVQKGMLEVRSQGDVYVTPRAGWSLMDDDVLEWHLSAKPLPDFLRRLLELRGPLEPSAAAWAARDGTDEQHQAIVDAVERMERNVAEVTQFVLADAHFHRTVMLAANNVFLRPTADMLFSCLLSSIQLTNASEKGNRGSVPLHTAIRDAVLARDSDAAEARMQDHIDDTIRRIVAADESGAFKDLRATSGGAAAAAQKDGFLQRWAMGLKRGL